MNVNVVGKNLHDNDNNFYWTKKRLEEFYKLRGQKPGPLSPLMKARLIVQFTKKLRNSGNVWMGLELVS